jgi:tRNA A22 N-methylase
MANDAEAATSPIITMIKATTPDEHNIALLTGDVLEHAQRFYDVIAEERRKGTPNSEIAQKLLDLSEEFAKKLNGKFLSSIQAHCNSCHDKIAELEKANGHLTDTVAMLTELEEEERLKTHTNGVEDAPCGKYMPWIDPRERNA